MFEKVSGFFKRFSRRRQRQSGETTIMDGKEPGVDDFGLDEGFGGLEGAEEPDFGAGAFPGKAQTGSEEADLLSDLDLGDEEPVISTGGTDFDARTISDEISGVESGVTESEGGAFSLGEEEEPFAEAFVEPKRPPLVKRIAKIAAVFIVAIGIGGVFQMFLWPKVGGLLGKSGPTTPTLDVQTQVNAAQREKAKLNTEISEFRKMGGPEEVKAMQQRLAQLRDTDGPLEEIENQYASIKEEETAYDDLVKQIGDLESQIADTNNKISAVKSEIVETRESVTELQVRMKEEFERFRVELQRADYSQRLLIELQLADIRSFRAEVDELESYLSGMIPAETAASPAEAESAVGATGK
jgi:hypothetical protein